jgi:hypothetical protein
MKDDKPRSLFPSYLFVETNCQPKSLYRKIVRDGMIVIEEKIIQGSWRVLLSTIGVRRILLRRTGELLEPQPVPQWIIDELKNQEHGGFYQFPEPAPRFMPRQTLRASDGLLRGKLCICEEMTSSDRVRVLFTGMGFQFRTEMSADHLEAV